MSTPKHTPGPWTVKGEDTVVGPQGNTIAECCGYSVRATDKDQIRQGGREANATFIAAAPAMYEALQMVSTILYDIADSAEDVAEWNEGGQMYELSRVVKTALAQAEGRG